MDLKEFVKRNMEAQPVEARIIRKTIRALKAYGTPVTEVFDGEEYVKVSGEREIMELAFNLDTVYLCADRGWVRFHLGEKWDTLSDYTVNLEEALKPVSDYIDKNMV